MGAICPAGRRVRDIRFERKNSADALSCCPYCRGRCGCLPQQSSPRRPSRWLDARTRAGRQTPLTTTAYSRPPKSRDSARFSRCPSLRKTGRVPACVLRRKILTRAPPLVTPPRPRRTPWRRQRRQAAAAAAAVRAAGECVSTAFTFETIIANPPLGRTNAPHSQLRRSSSLSRLYGARRSSPLSATEV